MEEEEKMRENRGEERDFEERGKGGLRDFEEHKRWKRGERKGREDPSYERNGTWSRKVGGERRRETLGGEGVEGRERKGLMGEEGSSLSRSASLPPASRERARVKRVRDNFSKTVTHYKCLKGLMYARHGSKHYDIELLRLRKGLD